MDIKFLQELFLLYGEKEAKKTEQIIEKLITQSKKKIFCKDQPFWQEKDVALITYPDSFVQKNLPSLKVLQSFLSNYLPDLFSIIHVLPFFPYSSDRGFSVIDYYQVKNEFGSWDDIVNISKSYRFMADLVINHISAKSEWFKKFLEADERYWNYFIHFREDEIPYEQIKKVFRPRATPLLTPFTTKKGKRFVWTTFSVEDSTDQVDLNFHNPQVLIEVVKILLFLLEKGVRIFRLDAVGYLWKKLGTNCLNLHEVHVIVSLIRIILDKICKSAIIIAENNQPYEENITYFGDGFHEAQIIYNFSLPSLVLYSFYNGSADILLNWTEKITPPSSYTTFFNFLDTHDGISISGARGILSEREIQNIVDRVIDHEGQVSKRLYPDGNLLVYELNSTWWSALNKRAEEPFDLQLNKFITSRAISMALAGIPAIYYLSLFGQENDLNLFEKTKIKRDINRTNLDLQILSMKLKNKNSRDGKIFQAMTSLIKKRKNIKAFHPNAKQKIVKLDKRVFSLVREFKGSKVLALHNVSSDLVEVRYDSGTYKLKPYSYLWVELSG